MNPVLGIKQRWTTKNVCGRWWCYFSLH